ncbi:MAG: hypothetical protein IJL67_13710 [Oscillospiraceae bacterium]|nr:hypothetical protein [Oscillospiraceae bacterium]
MIAFIIGIVLTIIFLIIDIGLLCSYAFLARITLVDSLAVGLGGGIALYLCNRAFDVPFFSAQVNPLICAGVVILLFVASYFLQKTAPGFWIFAVIFSVAWSFLAALTVYVLIKQSMTVFWIAFAVSMIMNIASHIRSRDAEFSLA